MAKNNTPTTDETLAVKAAEEAQAAPAEEKKASKAAPKSAWDETIEMFVPRKAKGDEQQYYVCVNDRRFAVPANNKIQKLPKPVALVLQESLEAENEADEFAESMPKEGIDPKQV